MKGELHRFVRRTFLHMYGSAEWGVGVNSGAVFGYVWEFRLVAARSTD